MEGAMIEIISIETIEEAELHELRNRPTQRSSYSRRSHLKQIAGGLIIGLSPAEIGFFSNRAQAQVTELLIAAAIEVGVYIAKRIIDINYPASGATTVHNTSDDTQEGYVMATIKNSSGVIKDQPSKYLELGSKEKARINIKSHPI